MLLHLRTTDGKRKLNDFLEGHTYLVGFALSLADIVAWGALKSQGFQKDDSLFVHIARWFRHCAAPRSSPSSPLPPPSLEEPQAAAPMSKKQRKKLEAARKKAEARARHKAAGTDKAKKNKVKTVAGARGKMGELRERKRVKLSPVSHPSRVVISTLAT